MKSSDSSDFVTLAVYVATVVVAIYRCLFNERTPDLKRRARDLNSRGRCERRRERDRRWRDPEPGGTDEI